MSVGKSNKTTIGQSIDGSRNFIERGSQNLNERDTKYGTVSDIRLPGELIDKTGSGIMVKINFDGNFNMDAWVHLKEEFNFVLSNLGNRDAILENPPSVSYTYNINRPYEGYAKLVTDNKQDGAYREFQVNKTGSFIASLMGLASNSKAF